MRRTYRPRSEFEDCVVYVAYLAGLILLVTVVLAYVLSGARFNPYTPSADELDVYDLGCWEDEVVVDGLCVPADNLAP